MLKKKRFTVLDVLLWDALETVILFCPTVRWEDDHGHKPQPIDERTKRLLQSFLNTDEHFIEKFLEVCVDRVSVRMPGKNVLRIAALRRPIELVAKLGTGRVWITLSYDSNHLKKEVVDHCLSRFFE